MSTTTLTGGPLRSLSSVLWDMIGPDDPIPAPESFAGLTDVEQVAWLVRWVEPQRTCDAILAAYGTRGLWTTLTHIATAASKLHVAMPSRVESVAGQLGVPTY